MAEAARPELKAPGHGKTIHATPFQIAIGAVALGAVAYGATAIGAFAAGVMMVRRLRILEARIEILSIGTPTEDHLNVRSQQTET